MYFIHIVNHERELQDIRFIYFFRKSETQQLRKQLSIVITLGEYFEQEKMRGGVKTKKRHVQREKGWRRIAAEQR